MINISDIKLTMYVSNKSNNEKQYFLVRHLVPLFLKRSNGSHISSIDTISSPLWIQVTLNRYTPRIQKIIANITTDVTDEGWWKIELCVWWIPVLHRRTQRLHKQSQSEMYSRQKSPCEEKRFIQAWIWWAKTIRQTHLKHIRVCRLDSSESRIQAETNCRGHRRPVNVVNGPVWLPWA